MAKKIIGIDHGHGECAAYMFNIDGGTRPEALYLDRDMDKVIPSAIIYRTNSGEANCAIGYEAASQQGVICYFKTAPSLWNDASGSPRRVNGHPVRQLMGDFMGQLYRQIWRYNLNVNLFDGDEIELYVGCPSSGTWTNAAERESYEALISEATGLNRAYVHVVEESTAAVFNSFIGRTAGISANNGVLVFDFGSSTADSTYIHTGRTMQVNSWTLGASEIERGMLRLLLEENDLTEKDIYQGDILRALLTLRLFKERYYSDSLGMDMISIQIPLVDGNGKLIQTTRNGKTVNKRVLLMPQSDIDDFMDAVTGSSPFEVTEDGQPKGAYTWEDGCRAFMEQMHDQIMANQNACAAVVLTGGASRMPFILNTARQLFEDMETTLPNGHVKTLTADDIYLEDVPSITVARGLCVIGQTDMMLPEIKKKLSSSIIDSRKAAFDTQVIDAVANQLANDAFNAALDEMTAINYTITAGQLLSRVQNAIELKLKDSAESTLIKKISAWRRETNAIVYKRVSEESQKLYRGLLPADAVTLPRFDQLPKHVADLGKMIDNIAIACQNFMQTFLATALAAIVGGVLFIILDSIPVIGPIIAGLAAGMVYLWVLNNPDHKVTTRDLQTAAAKYADNRVREVKKYKATIKPELSWLLPADDYVKDIPRMIDDMLDIVALKKFPQTTARTEMEDDV